MAELKQYRLHLPKPLMWTAVALMGVLCVAGMGAVLVEMQLSSAIQHADAALAGPRGLLPAASSTVAGVGSQAQISLVDAGDQMHSSLARLDAQLATVGPVVSSAKPVLDGLAADTAKLGASIDRVNAPCVPGPCGTLADVNKTLNTVRGTFGQIEIAANHEDRNLDKLDVQEEQIFQDFHGTAARTNTALDTFNVLLARPSLAVMLDKGGSIMTTTDAVETKLARCTLHPTIGCVLKADAMMAAQFTGYLLR